MNYAQGIDQLMVIRDEISEVRSPYELKFRADKAIEVISKIIAQSDAHELSSDQDCTISEIESILGKEVELAKFSDTTGKAKSARTKPKVRAAEVDFNRATSRLRISIGDFVEKLKEMQGEAE